MGDTDANVSILPILAVLMVILSTTREYRMSRDQWTHPQSTCHCTDYCCCCSIWHNYKWALTCPHPVLFSIDLSIQYRIGLYIYTLLSATSFCIKIFPKGDGPLLEVLQYQGNPRGGRSKLLSTPQVSKIGLIAWGSVTPVRAIKLERTVISTWS